MDKEKPISVHHSIAEHYWLDARDFLSRFDSLWETETHKTGRIKAFVDLLIGCECALKSHAMLGLADKDPKEAYSKLRKAGHRISELADLSRLNKDRSSYDFLKNEISRVSVNIRYSLDAYDTFFPMKNDWSEANINYSTTISSQPWVMSIRAALSNLIDDLNPHLTGLCSNDIEMILKNDEEVKKILTNNNR